MKMLYSKPSWSTQALTDLLAPVAKFQIRGEKLILACPFACLAANIRSKARGVPPSVVNMCEEMLAMDVKAFEEAGGACICMQGIVCGFLTAIWYASSTWKSMKFLLRSVGLP